MSNYYRICKAFVAGEEIKKSWLSRVGGSKGGMYGWAGQGPLYSKPGTVRLAVVHDQDGYGRLVSYGHFDLAVRKSDGQIIANGDNAPTVTSRKQQRDFRSALGGAKACLLPFSALQAARIRPGNVVIVDTTPDREIETWKKCRCDKSWHQKENVYLDEPSDFRFHADGSHDVKITRHFLGETLFTREDRPGHYYVSGLDRNDDPSKRHFYLAQLPDGVAPKTVDEALETLKPEGLPETGWLRQGEWFLVPSDVKPKKASIVSQSRAIRYGSNPMKPGVPVITADPARMNELLTSEWPWELVDRARRHRATRMYLNGSVFVSGMLRDEEHTALKIGDGKTWYRVVRNRAQASWGAGGVVD